jgi:hypothetical protein
MADGELLARVKRNLRLVEDAGPSEDAKLLEPGEAWEPDLIPDVFDGDSDSEGHAVDLAVSALGIVNAYRRYCGKMEPRVGGRTESIMVSCPNPAHPDEHPSAWLNSAKDVGNCASCGGFDIYDVFAWSKGYPVPEYRTSDFAKVRADLASDLGIGLARVGRREMVVEVIEDDGEPGPPEVAVGPDDEIASVTHLHVFGDEEVFTPHATFNWRDVIDESSTFLFPWMQECSKDDLPEEFYFFLGLQALAAALGNDCRLSDSIPVRGNLMTCLVGASGLGKSRAIRVMERLLREAFPFDPTLGGVKLIANVGSGESLMDEFSHPILDPTDPTKVAGFLPVNGMVKVDELATLTSKANRNGSVIKQTMMELYDSDSPLALRSRTHGLTRVENHFIQSTTSTQPSVIQDLIHTGDAMGGFINRWVFVSGAVKKLVAINGTTLDVSGLVPNIVSVHAFGRRHSRVVLDTEAVELWSEFFERELVPLKVDESKPAYARTDLLFKKLMLLFAADKTKAIVTKETVEQVLRLWPYVRQMYGFMNENTAMKRSEQIDALENRLHKIANVSFARYGKHPTIAEIHNRVGKDRARFTRAEINKAVETLVESGLLKPVIVKHGKTGTDILRYQAVVFDEEATGD